MPIVVHLWLSTYNLFLTLYRCGFIFIEIFRSHTKSLTANESSTHFAATVDCAVTVCFLLHQETPLPESMKTNPEVYFLPSGLPQNRHRCIQ